MTPLPLDCVIVGAGISGLTAAYTLHRSGKRVLVIDANPLPGGAIRSSWVEAPEGRYLVEWGPNSMTSTSETLARLCSELALAPLTAAPAAKKRYIYLYQRVQALPGNPLGLATTQLLSAQGKLRLLTEPFQPARSPNAPREESIAEFISRRLGPEVLHHLMAPFVSGVYAGDPAALSMAATFPKLAEWERAHGGLLKGAIASLRAARQQRRGRTAPAPKRRYTLMSFAEGLAELPRALASTLPQDALRLGQPVTSLESTANGFRLTVADNNAQAIETRSVILATPAAATAQWLNQLGCLEAANALLAMPYAPMAVVHLGIPLSQIPRPLDGFGFLVPRVAGVPLLGCIWSSALFSNRAPQGYGLLTCFLGGALMPEVADWTDNQVLAQVLGDLRQILGAPSLAPTMTHVVRWRQAIPQYTLGHLARVQQVQAAVQAIPGLAVAGNLYAGVSLNDSASSGEAAAKQILAFISSQSGTESSLQPA